MIKGFLRKILVILFQLLHNINRWYYTRKARKASLECGNNLRVNYKLNYHKMIGP